ncbi:RHS repeat-associated core domain-containing protein [Nonomuraea sp. NPDC049637]|uniref:RHS repeat domain-containing protein n=1 Tax=Nonomuraea sp. NPDC049637 TaxID=3154356 RepID=UPI0034266B4B
MRLRTLLCAGVVTALITALAPAAPAAAFWPPQPDPPVGTGPTRNGTFLTYQVSDHVEVKVNVGSGNALVRTADLTQPALSRTVTLGAVYNSLLLGHGMDEGLLGNGWRTREGFEQQLFEAEDGAVLLVDGDGVNGKFTLKSGSTTSYASPKEFKADLTKNSAGDWTLTYHDEGRKLLFDSSGRLDSNKDRNGNYTHFSYVDGDPVDVEFIARGTLSAAAARAAAGDDPGLVYVTTNADGTISGYRQSDGTGTTRTVTYAYNSGKELASLTDPTGARVEFGYASGHLLTSIRNARGKELRLAYDADRRVTSVTQVNDSGAPSITRLTYPSATQTLVADAGTDQAQPVSSVPHTTYKVNSSSKRITETTDPAGHTRKRAYTPFFDVASSVTATGGTTTNTYGANNGESMTTSKAATGATTTLAYANPATSTNPTAAFQPSSFTDPQKNKTTLTYNGAGNLSSSADATAAKAKVDYNDDGTVKSSTDPKNGSNSTTYAYDTDPWDGTPFRTLTKITPPTGNSLGVRTFTYDGFGRLLTGTDGAGRKASYEYDLSDRITRASFSDGTPAVAYVYDAAGNLTTRTDASGATTWAYDARNQVLTRTSASGGGTLRYAYDLVGNLISLTDGRGTTTYAYDSRNLMSSMTGASGHKWRFTHDDDGRRTGTSFNSPDDSHYALRTKTSYDDSGRIKRITSTRASSDSDVVSDLSYCYSAGTPCATTSGNDSDLRYSAKDEQSGEVTVYSYDKANRLTKATNVHGHDYTYTYDADGNRTTDSKDGAQQHSYTFNSANQIDGDNAAFDGAGNQTTSGFLGTMTYNAAGQLTSRGKDGTTTTNRYADRGNTELVSAGAFSLVYGKSDQNEQPWLQSYANGSVTNYVERDGRGTPLGLISSSGAYAYVLDALGSVTAVVDASGTVAATHSYDAYGQTVATTGSVPGTNILRYAGGLNLAPDISPVKLGQRWYNSATGRFTQQDSLTFLGDTKRGNRYAYAACNPVNYTDPTGRVLSETQNCAVQGLIWGGAAALAGGIAGAFSGGLGIAVGVIGGFTTGLAAGAGSCLVSYASE